MEIEINESNVGYYSIYRSPEKTYIELNNNIPCFTQSEINRALNDINDKYAAVNYGCSGLAFACIRKQEENQDQKTINRKHYKKPRKLSDVKSKYVEGGYLYNQCHLIGFQFKPFNNKENLIIGTRYFNINGMLPFENRVKDYINKGGCVLYRIKPCFKENDILAYGVQMEALSIVDNEENEKLQFNVFVYNKQPGISINYESGESCEDASWTELVDKLNKECDCTFNIKTKKIHVFDSICEKESEGIRKRKNFYPGITETLLKHGGSYCKTCYPQML